MKSGDELREQGIRRVSAADMRQAKAIDDAILHLARIGDPFTADDIRAIAGNPSRPNMMGARLHTAARAGWIQTSGYLKSERPKRHSGVIRSWIASKNLMVAIVKREREVSHGSSTGS